MAGGLLRGFFWGDFEVIYLGNYGKLIVVIGEFVYIENNSYKIYNFCSRMSKNPMFRKGIVYI